MADRIRAHSNEGLSGGALVVGLLAKYIGLALYGGTAIVVEIPTLVIAGGSGFALTWAMLVAGLGLAASAGVVHTWRTGHYKLEQWTTGALILVFLVYAWSLMFRAVSTQNWASATLAWIPILLTFFPAIRFFLLVRRRDA